MQPTVTQMPPTRSRSTRATFAPFTAAWRAAPYPPGPPPSIAMSYVATNDRPDRPGRESRSRRRRSQKEPRVFRRVSLQRMLEISVLRAIPEIERQERQPKPFVLRDMPQLVTPHGRRWLEARDDHVAEGDRAESAPSQDEIRETAIAP